MLTVFVLAGILVLVHVFSEEYSKHVEKFHVHTLSFSAGLFLGIIFLNLLPEAFKGMTLLGENIFLLMLSGFVLFHLGEKYIYQHIKDKNRLLKNLGSIHALGYFVNHFVVGIALFLAFKQESFFSGFLIFITLLLHSFSSSLSLNHIDKHFNRKSLSGFFLPLSPLFGVAFAYFLNPTAFLYYAIFSFVIGAMLYVVIRDAIPRKENGKPVHFLIGALLSILASIVIGVL